jgi:hypothetical protein
MRAICVRSLRSNPKPASQRSLPAGRCINGSRNSKICGSEMNAVRPRPRRRMWRRLRVGGAQNARRRRSRNRRSKRPLLQLCEMEELRVATIHHISWLPPRLACGHRRRMSGAQARLIMIGQQRSVEISTPQVGLEPIPPPLQTVLSHYRQHRLVAFLAFLEWHQQSAIHRCSNAGFVIGIDQQRIA